jgi:hypothetical protein
VEAVSRYRSIAALAYPAEEFQRTTISKFADDLGQGSGAECVQDVTSYLSGGAPEQPMRPTPIGDISCSS